MIGNGGALWSTYVHAGRHRAGRGLSRRGVAALLVPVILSSFIVVATIATNLVTSASAAELPDGGLVPSVADSGHTSGQFAVSGDGAATYHLPLWVPAGRGAPAPNLALSYNSRAGNGMVGVGWSLTGLKSINQCPRTLAQDGFGDTLHYDRTDVYCMGSDRLRPIDGVIGGQQEFRTDVESFSRIIAFGMEDGIPSHFEVRGRDGLVYTFGGTANSRHEAFRLRPKAGAAGQLERDSTTPRVIGWMVNRVQDRNTNAMTVEYGKLLGTEEELWWSDIFPVRIQYAPNREVRFLYDGLGDKVDGFAAGVHTRVSQRLRTIRMSGGREGDPSRVLRAYQLSYQENSTTGRTLLASVKECDGDGICKLPLELDWSLGGYFATVRNVGADDVAHAASAGKRIHVLDINGDGKDDVLYTDGGFNWLLRRSTGDGFSSAVPAGIPRVSDDQQGQLRLADIDRDGRTDVIAEVPGARNWRLYRSNGSQFVVHPDNLEFDTTGTADPVYLVDLDGGGNPDILTASIDSNVDDRLDGPWHYRINDGNDAGGRFGPDVDARTSVPSLAFTGAVADVDGNGRQELIGKDNAVNGAALGLDASGEVAISTLNYAPLETTRDVNGDGLPDQLSFGTNAIGPGNRTIKAVVNSGNGGANSLESTVTLPPGRHGVHVGDFTGDGVDDVLFLLTGRSSGPNDFQHGPQLYSWRGRGFVRLPVDWPDSYTFDEFTINSLQVLDIDGNGVLDFIFNKFVIGEPGLRLMKRGDQLPDRLTRIGSPAHSASVGIDYATWGDRSVHTPCASSGACLTAGGSVVRTHVLATFSSDPGNPADTFTHSYQGARRDLRGRGWLGVSNHTVARSLTGESMTTFFDAPQEPFARAGLPVLVVTTGTDRLPGSGGTIRDFQRAIFYERTVRQYPNGTHRWELTRTSAGESERVRGSTGPWATIHHEEVATLYDDFGNPRTVESTTTGGRRSTEVTVFRNTPDTWLLGLPERKTVTGCNAGNALCETRTMAFDYDARGNQTVSIVEPDKPLQKLTTTTVPGQFGEVISVTRTDGAGRSRGQTLEYDVDRLHATATVATVGAIEHRTQVEMHSGLGVALRTVDVNGVPATMQYDGFGRPREVHRADGSFELIDYAPFFSGQSTSTTRSDGSVDGVIHDQLGRERQRQTKTFDGSRALVNMDYNALGLVSRVSRPRLSSQVPVYTTTEYDLRGRVIATTAPDGARTRHTYAGLRTDSFTAMNKQTRVERNADGDIARSSDLVGETGNWLTTTFEYGAFGGTTKRIAPDGTTWEAVSDKQTRRKETVTDPASGVTTTFYNAFGDVEEQTRAGNRTTTFTYDELGRAKEVRSPDGLARNIWDTAPHGIGKLTNARSSDQIVTEHTYDDLARPGTTTTRIGGVGYQVRHSYDLIGRLSTVTYPEIPGAAAAGRLQVGYEYNHHGYLVRVRDTAAGGPVFWTGEERNPAGLLVRERFGNGVVTVNGYQPATGLLTGRTVTGPGAVGTLASLGYQFNLDRSVTQRRAVVTGESDRTDGYLYDTLDRLRGWSTTSTGQPSRSTSFVHDAVGNLKTETIAVTGAPTRTVSYTYGRDVPDSGAPPHALISRDGVAYGYDAGGRQVTGDGRSIVYTMADLPKSVTRDGQRTDLAYDATGARVRQSDAAQTIAYVPGLFERRQSTAAGNTRVENVHHVGVDGRVIAQVIRAQNTPTGPATTRTHYLHSDVQGSVAAVTGPDGRLAGGSLARLAYDPFGQRIDAVTSEPLAPARRDDLRLGYTQHEHDDNLGLINMKGRINDPVQRRFLSPDPVTAEPRSSQTNRYSYVRNNPTTLTDPTGFIAEENCASTIFNCGDGGRIDSWANPWTRGVSTIYSNNVGSTGWGPNSPPSYLQPPSLLDGGTVIVYVPVIAAPRANVGNGADDDATKTASTTTQSGDSVAGDVLQGVVDLLGTLAETKEMGKLGAVLKALDGLVDIIGFVKSGSSDEPADGWLALLPESVQDSFDGFMDVTGAASMLKVLGSLGNKAVGGGLGGAVGGAGAAVATGIEVLARANLYTTVAVMGFSAGLYLREKFDAWTGTDDLIEGIGIAAGRGYQAVQEWTSSPTPLQRDILIPIREHYGLGRDVPVDVSAVQDAINGIRSPAGGITIRFGN